MLNRKHDNWTTFSYLQFFKGNALNVSPLCIMFAVVFLFICRCHLSNLEYPSVPGLQRVFFLFFLMTNGFLNENFFCTDFDKIFHLIFISEVNWIIDFLTLN